ncbi:MAG: hypothetical protein JWN25_189 [Verrucomicrobiales bacterium]|nr:hypothetical protein [Verrucomicrobiales bacterium]
MVLSVGEPVKVRDTSLLKEWDAWRPKAKRAIPTTNKAIETGLFIFFSFMVWIQISVRSSSVPIVQRLATFRILGMKELTEHSLRVGINGYYWLVRVVQTTH